jgi:hypothetical protein
MNVKRLRAHVSRGLTLRITLRNPPDRNLHGFPTAASGAMLLMHELNDFQPWGWVAVPWGNIVAFRSGRFERFAERVLAGEGVAARPCPLWIDTSSVATLLTSLMKRRRNVVIETADVAARSEPGERSFYLGRIRSVNSSHVSIRTVTALARWDRRATRVSLGDIALVQFDDPYTRTFSKYAPYSEE